MNDDLSKDHHHNQIRRSEGMKIMKNQNDGIIKIESLMERIEKMENHQDMMKIIAKMIDRDSSELLSMMDQSIESYDLKESQFDDDNHRDVNP